MRVLLAFDKFKDALGAREACRVAAEALQSQHPDWECDLCPLTDGGEGFAEILTAGPLPRRVCLPTITTSQRRPGWRWSKWPPRVDSRFFRRRAEIRGKRRPSAPANFFGRPRSTLISLCSGLAAARPMTSGSALFRRWGWNFSRRAGTRSQVPFPQIGKTSRTSEANPPGIFRRCSSRVM